MWAFLISSAKFEVSPLYFMSVLMRRRNANYSFILVWAPVIVVSNDTGGPGEGTTQALNTVNISQSHATIL